jgi:hypothetical protein
MSGAPGSAETPPSLGTPLFLAGLTGERARTSDPIRLRAARKVSRVSGVTRMLFKILVCCNSPLSQSLYTVAVEIRRRVATSRTPRRRDSSVRGGVCRDEDRRSAGSNSGKSGPEGGTADGGGDGRGDDRLFGVGVAARPLSRGVFGCRRGGGGASTAPARANSLIAEASNRRRAPTRRHGRRPASARW